MGTQWDGGWSAIRAHTHTQDAQGLAAAAADTLLSCRVFPPRHAPGESRRGRRLHRKELEIFP